MHLYCHMWVLAICDGNVLVTHVGLYGIYYVCYETIMHVLTICIHHVFLQYVIIICLHHVY